MSRRRAKKFYNIWIDGLVAVGKSTAAIEIAKRIGAQVMHEPVKENWYLKDFYDNPQKYAFGMQMMMLMHRFAVKQIAGYSGCLGKHIIVDRSIAGDWAFAQLHIEEGNISPHDARTYEFAYDLFANSIKKPTVLVYLKVQPETAFRRMQERAREAEKLVPIEYLQKLYLHYERLMQLFETGLTPWDNVKVHRILWDRDVTTKQEWDALAQDVMDACEGIG